MSDYIKTPLFSWHQQWAARMVDFAGYYLPLSYAGGGLIAEHEQTRGQASLFDVSHMGQVMIRPSAAAVLSTLVAADVSAIPVGESRYTYLMTAKGGALDDCIISNDGDRGFFLVLNASRKHIAIDYLRAKLPAPDDLLEYQDRSLIAIQGPAAAAAVTALSPAADTLTFMHSIWTDIDGLPCRLARCGYTGEDGFEISVAAAEAIGLAERLVQQTAVGPAGLGARDSLRLEAGLCLYGHELDENTTPVEADLLWIIPPHRRQGSGYVGAEKIAQQIASGPPRRRIGLRVQGKTPVRQGASLSIAGERVGVVTSGSYSPTLAAPIALAYVKTAAASATQLTASVRGRDVVCQRVTLPFVPHRYHR